MADDSFDTAEALLDAVVQFKITDGYFMRRLSEFGDEARSQLPKLVDLVERADFTWLWGSAIAMIDPMHPTPRRLLNDELAFVREKVIEGMATSDHLPPDWDAILRAGCRDNDHDVRASTGRLAWNRGHLVTEIALALFSHLQPWPQYSDSIAEREGDHVDWQNADISRLRSSWGADLKLLIEIVEADPDAELVIRRSLEQQPENRLHLNHHRLLWKLGMRRDAITQFIIKEIEEGSDIGLTAACELAFLIGRSAAACFGALIDHGESDGVTAPNVVRTLGSIGVRNTRLLSDLLWIVLDDPPSDGDTELPVAAAEALGKLMPEIDQLTPMLLRVVRDHRLRSQGRRFWKRDQTTKQVERWLAEFVR